MGITERSQFVRIGDLNREYSWENSLSCGPCGEMERWDELNEAPHRKGELALFSPTVEDFYSGRTGEWTVRKGMTFGGEIDSFRPFTIDLTKEHPVMMEGYDFDSSKRLAVVCDCSVKHEEQKGTISIRYSLLPLKEGEYVAVSEDEAREPENFGALSSFYTFVSCGFINLNDIPVEIIKRVGEIDRDSLRKKPSSK